MDYKEFADYTWFLLGQIAGTIRKTDGTDNEQKLKEINELVNDFIQTHAKTEPTLAERV